METSSKFCVDSQATVAADTSQHGWLPEPLYAPMTRPLHVYKIEIWMLWRRTSARKLGGLNGEPNLSKTSSGCMVADLSP